MARKARIRHVYTKAVGVTFRNEDGSDRQRIIARCAVGEQLLLRHDDHILGHPNAIALVRQNGEQLGHLRDGFGDELVAKFQQGYRLGAWITELTGGHARAPTRGVNLLLLIMPPGTTDAEGRAYVYSLTAAEVETQRECQPDAKVFAFAGGERRRRSSSFGLWVWLVLTGLLVAALALGAIFLARLVG